jgi:hypothetical protein
MAALASSSDAFGLQNAVRHEVEVVGVDDSVARTLSGSVVAAALARKQGAIMEE